MNDKVDDFLKTLPDNIRAKVQDADAKASAHFAKETEDLMEAVQDSVINLSLVAHACSDNPAERDMLGRATSVSLCALTILRSILTDTIPAGRPRTEVQTTLVRGFAEFLQKFEESTPTIIAKGVERRAQILAVANNIARKNAEAAAKGGGNG